MDWFSLTSEVLAKRKEECEEEQKSLSRKPKNETLEKEVGGKLSPLEAAAVACVLETASLQLFIIDAGTCDVTEDSTNAVVRKKVIEVIQKTEEELRGTGTFEVLKEKVKEEEEIVKAAKSLQESLLQNQVKIKDLKEKLRENELTKLREMNQKQEIIASLKDKIHDEITKSGIKLRYTDRWEAARQGQHRMRCQKAELELERKLEEITNKCNNEIRAHDEICTFLALEEQVKEILKALEICTEMTRQMHKDLLQEIEKWKETYDKEMKRRTEKIKFLQEKKKEQQILHRDLLQLYEEHQKEINDYLNFKERLRKERERERFINDMATKIQAWWRGTMVRRGLGPFKKKKKVIKEKKKK